MFGVEENRVDDSFTRLAFTKLIHGCACVLQNYQQAMN